MKRSLRGPVLLGSLCGVIAFLVSQLGWLAALDSRAYDFSIRMRNTPGPSPQIAIIEIDDESISLLGRWPWRRSIHAKFLAALRERYQPTAVVFDLLLSEPEVGQQDAALAREIAEAGNVYLAAFFTDIPESGLDLSRERIPWVTGEYTGEATWLGKQFASLHPPIYEFAQKAAGIGYVNIFPELDGCVRRVPLVIDYQGIPYLSLIAVVFHSIIDPDQQTIPVALGETISIGDFDIPIDFTGETLIGYNSSPRNLEPVGFARYPYHSILTRDVPLSALKDKIVLVGFGATGMADIHPTPLSAGAFGVEINAHALSGLLQGSFLRTSAWHPRLVFAILWGLFAALFAGAWSPLRALAAASALPILGTLAAAWALSASGVWLGAAAPGVAAAAAYTTMIAFRYRESERDALRVNASVETFALATRVIGSARRREDLLNEIRSQVHDVVDALQVNLYLLDEETDRLTLSLPTYTERQPISYAVGEGTVGWVARYPDVHLVDQIHPATDLATELSKSVSFPVRSVLYAPMSHRGRIVGVVEAVRGADQRPFENRHLQIAEALATEAAVALENVSLYEKLEGRVEIANRRLLAAFQELKQERDRISAIVTNMADGVILTDAQRRIRFLNPAAAHMLNLDPGDTEGQLASEVLPYPPILEQLDGDAKPSVEIPRLHLAEPCRIILSPRTVRLISEQGTHTGAITVLSDITLLEELSEMKTEFVSIVSHELRTPLTSIMGFAQTLRGDLATLEEHERSEFLGIIEQESNRLLVMINDLLDMSRMEAGRPLPINYALVNIKQLAEHVVRFQSVTTTLHNFAFEFPENAPAVQADPDKVEQILTNLVSNAIKYSPKGGEVALGAYSEDDYCTIYVRDRGIGMTAEEVSRLFQPYQRIDRDAIKGIRGTGLGLYLVRALVEAHRGRVWVESEPGKGSSFYLSLPLRPPDENNPV